MAGEVSKIGGNDGPSASRAEIDALSEIIAATIAMAVRARSDAATTLLERALAMLNDRAAAAVTCGEDGRTAGFRHS